MKNQPERCVHCLIQSSELTRDHILPKSYYPDSTSPEIERWTAPACEKCNLELGKIEEELLTLLGLSLNPRADSISGTSSISQKVLRSLNPKAAKNERDQKMRHGKALKIVRGIFRADGSTKGMFPNFGYHAGWKPEEQYGVYIPADKIEKFGCKMVRGLEYKLQGRVIDPSSKLEVFYCHEDTIQDVIQVIHRFGKHHVITPGFEFYRASPDQSNKHALYQIRIWDKFVIYGSIVQKPWWRLPFDFKFLKYRLFKLAGF